MSLVETLLYFFSFFKMKRKKNFKHLDGKMHAIFFLQLQYWFLVSVLCFFQESTEVFQLVLILVKYGNRFPMLDNFKFLCFRAVKII